MKELSFKGAVAILSLKSCVYHLTSMKDILKDKYNT